MYKIFFSLLPLIFFFQNNVAANIVNQLNIKYNGEGYEKTVIEIRQLIQRNEFTASHRNILSFAVDISFANNDFDTTYIFLLDYERRFGLDNFNIAHNKLKLLLVKKEYSTAKELTDFILKSMASDYNTISQITNTLLRYGLIDKTLEVYNAAKVKLNNPHIFLPVLINIYIAQNRYDSAVIEYTEYFLNHNNQYYLREFNQILYEHKLFDIFIRTAENKFGGAPQKLLTNIQLLPITADAYFYTKRFNEAAAAFIEYFKSTQYNAEIITGIFNKFIDADYKKFAAELLYKMISDNENFMNQSAYNQNLFKLYIAGNPFYLHLLADNIELFKSDQYFMKMLIETLAEYPNDYFEIIAEQINDTAFVYSVKLKYYYICGNYDSALEIAANIKTIKSADVLFIAGLINLYKGYFDAAKIYFENIILNFGDSDFSFEALVYYKIIESETDRGSLKILTVINEKTPADFDFNILDEIKLIEDDDIKALAYLLLMNKGFQKVFELDFDAEIKTSVFKPELDFKCAVNLLKLNYPGEAKQKFEKIIFEYQNSLFDAAAKKMLKLIY